MLMTQDMINELQSLNMKITTFLDQYKGLPNETQTTIHTLKDKDDIENETNQHILYITYHLELITGFTSKHQMTFAELPDEFQAHLERLDALLRIHTKTRILKIDKQSPTLVRAEFTEKLPVFTLSMVTFDQLNEIHTKAKANLRNLVDDTANQNIVDRANYILEHLVILKDFLHQLSNNAEYFNTFSLSEFSTIRSNCYRISLEFTDTFLKSPVLPKRIIEGFSYLRVKILSSLASLIFNKLHEPEIVRSLPNDERTKTLKLIYQLYDECNTILHTMSISPDNKTALDLRLKTQNKLVHSAYKLGNNLNTNEKHVYYKIAYDHFVESDTLVNHLQKLAILEKQNESTLPNKAECISELIQKITEKHNLGQTVPSMFKHERNLLTKYIRTPVQAATISNSKSIHDTNDDMLLITIEPENVHQTEIVQEPTQRKEVLPVQQQTRLTTPPDPSFWATCIPMLHQFNEEFRSLYNDYTRQGNFNLTLTIQPYHELFKDLTAYIRNENPELITVSSLLESPYHADLITLAFNSNMCLFLSILSDEQRSLEKLNILNKISITLQWCNHYSPSSVIPDFFESLEEFKCQYVIKHLTMQFGNSLEAPYSDALLAEFGHCIDKIKLNENTPQVLISLSNTLSFNVFSSKVDAILQASVDIDKTANDLLTELNHFEQLNMDDERINSIKQHINHTLKLTKLYSPIVTQDDLHRFLESTPDSISTEKFDFDVLREIACNYLRATTPDVSRCFIYYKLLSRYLNWLPLYKTNGEKLNLPLPNESELNVQFIIKELKIALVALRTSASESTFSDEIKTYIRTLYKSAITSPNATSIASDPVISDPSTTICQAQQTHQTSDFFGMLRHDLNLQKTYQLNDRRITALQTASNPSDIDSFPDPVLIIEYIDVYTDYILDLAEKNRLTDVHPFILYFVYFFHPDERSEKFSTFHKPIFDLLNQCYSKEQGPLVSKLLNFLSPKKRLVLIDILTRLSTDHLFTMTQCTENQIDMILQLLNNYFDYLLSSLESTEQVIKTDIFFRNTHTIRSIISLGSDEQATFLSNKLVTLIDEKSKCEGKPHSFFHKRNEEPDPSELYRHTHRNSLTRDRSPLRSIDRTRKPYRGNDRMRRIDRDQRYRPSDGDRTQAETQHVIKNRRYTRN